MVTLVGTGGVGKTRLALELAIQLQTEFDKVWFVPLAQVRDPNLVGYSVVTSLGLIESAEISTGKLIHNYLAGKRALIVLDNFEHVLEAAPFVSELMRNCPDLNLLVTSRAPLHLAGEYEFEVLPLALPATKNHLEFIELSQYHAVALFVQRASASYSRFEFTTTNAQAVLDICKRLEGLPLALELAAAWLKMLSPEQLLAQLNNPLKILVGGSIDLLPHQRTILNTIEWSYQLLNEQEKRLFQAMSIFVSGCTVEAARVVSNPLDEFGWLVELRSLAEKNLVRQQESTESEPRLVMLEVVREFGLMKLREQSGEDVMRERHLDYYLKLSQEGEEKLKGREQKEWKAKLEQEHPNFRMALEWSLQYHPEKGLELAGNLALFWIRQTNLKEGRLWSEKALSLINVLETDTDLRIKAKALYGLAAITKLQDDRNYSKGKATEALELARQIGDLKLLTIVLSQLGTGTVNLTLDAK